MLKFFVLLASLCSFSAWGQSVMIGNSQTVGTTALSGNSPFVQLSIVGQSLAVGECDDAFPTCQQYFSSTNPNPYGNRLLTTTTANTLFESAGNDGIGGPGEHPRSGMANSLAYWSGRRVVVDELDALGATAYSGLKKGTAPYSNWLTALGAVIGLLPGGSIYRFGGIAVEHGERDFRNDVLGSTYAADLVEWQSDMSADIVATVGDTSVHPLFVSQVNSWPRYDSCAGTLTAGNTVGNATPTTCAGAAGTPLGMLAACRAHSTTIFCVGPKYQYTYTTGGLHPSSASYLAHGEQIGRAMKVVLVDGQTWTGLVPRSITRSGAVITARFWVPVAPLVIDTSTLSDKGNGKGFEYYNDGTPPAISSVSVSGDTATITLASTPSGFTTEHLRYAFTASGQAGTSGGPHGNIRDSDATLGPASGAHLYNWAWAFDDALPFTWAP